MVAPLDGPINKALDDLDKLKDHSDTLIADSASNLSFQLKESLGLVAASRLFPSNDTPDTIANNIVTKLSFRAKSESVKAQTPAFQCLEDYNKCREGGTPPWLCTTTLLICFAERVIPSAGKSN